MSTLKISINQSLSQSVVCVPSMRLPGSVRCVEVVVGLWDQHRGSLSSSSSHLLRPHQDAVAAAAAVYGMAESPFKRPRGFKVNSSRWDLCT